MSTPLVIMIALYIGAKCCCLDMKRVQIMISFIAMVSFVFAVSAALGIFKCTEPSATGLDADKSFLVASPEIEW